jgi:aspartyl aminopeptidase
MADLTSALGLVRDSPTPPHFISNSRTLLLSRGFVELRESDPWESLPPRFFVVRGERALIAVTNVDTSSGVIIASNLDVPCFKAKSNPDLSQQNLQQAHVAPYGDSNWCEWLDRRLSIAGRVIAKSKDETLISLYNTPDPAAIIPSLAPHLERTISLKPVFNLQANFVPVLGVGTSPVLNDIIAKAASIPVTDLLDFDATFYDANPPKRIGIKKDLIAGARLTNLAISAVILNSLIETENPTGLNICVLYDSLLVGGNGHCGPKSNFLTNLLERINVPQPWYRQALFIAGDTLACDAKGATKVGGGVCVHGSASISKLLPETGVQETETQGKIAEILKQQFDGKTVTVAVPVMSRFGVREVMAVDDLESAASLFARAYKGEPAS